jgi:16S rRNA (guanine527-N7)-methyltransferase
MDVGSGGGLPGLALALARPTQRLALVEATGKKAGFLESSVQRFGLAPAVTVTCARAEALGHDPAWRGRAAVVFFKAVGSLAELCELGLPLLNDGGALVAYKGPKAEEEAALAARALQLLHGKIETVRPYTLGWQNDQRSLVVVRKTGPTPKAYPRAAGMPKKAPL